ncbi:MAG: tubulin-like doman-containing protein [Gemmatales bacterium]
MPIRIETDAEPIPGYRLISRIGGGGYGDVWKCEVPGGLNKAIKFVFGNLEPTENVIGDDADDGRAVQEWKSLERVRGIRHPFILALDRYEIVEGQLMIVSELADCSLYDRFKECQKLGLPGIPRDELLNYMLETAEALDYMTEKHDLLHLDIKPQNLFLLCNHIKIGDFGLVKDVEGKLASVTGGFTAIYAAPESFEGYVTRFSDQYSLAIVYQELLTGHRPFTGNTPKQLLMQHLQGQPALEPLPEYDRAIIAKALSKTPAERWQRSMDMVHALTRAEEMQARQNTVYITRAAETETVENIQVESRPRHNRRQDASSVPYSQTEPLTKLRSAHIKELGIKEIVSPDAGVLRPVIFVGLGNWGRTTLQILQQSVKEQLGCDQYPLMSMLAVDTDPTPPQVPTLGQRLAEDFVHMPLSRPARYIRSKDELPPVEGWLDSNLLYRMPRNLVTNGIRSFGRLAFIEHHAVFMTRLEREIKRMLKEEPGIEAAQLTGQKLRKLEPLIYLVTHLGGGTGSGMLLDCAMIAHTVMKKLSCGGEVGAILFTPEQQDELPPDLPEANAVAALHELQYYQRSDSTFQAKYHARHEAIQLTEAPFSHCLFLELPSRPQPEHQKLKDPALTVISKFTHTLTRVLLSSLGQVSDPSWLARSSKACYQSISSFRIASSRTTVIQQAASNICNHVLDHWLKENDERHIKHVQSGMEDWLKQLRLDSKEVYAVLDDAVTRELGSKSEAYATTTVASLSKPIKEYLPKPNEIDTVLNTILDTLGNNRPDDSASVSMLQPSIRVGRVLRSAMDQVVDQASESMHRAITRLVDVPNKRLGAAEEALQSYSRYLAKAIQKHTQESQLHQQQFVQALSLLKSDLIEYERLRQTTKFLWPKMVSPGQHLFVIYTERYQALLHERIVTIYTELGMRCSRTAQELRKFRTSLLDLRQRFRKLSDQHFWDQEKEREQGQHLLVPPGYSDLLQVVQQLSDSMSNEEMAKIDQQLSEDLKKHYPSLMETARGGSDSLMPLRSIIQSNVISYLETQLPQTDLLGQIQEEQPSIGQTINLMHEQAELPLQFTEETKAFELVFLALPESVETERVQKEISLTFPDLVTVTASRQEMVLHRAILGIDLNDLGVMNPVCLQAYETAKNIENFTPHARQDIVDWVGPPATGVVRR